RRRAPVFPPFSLSLAVHLSRQCHLRVPRSPAELVAPAIQHRDPPEIRRLRRSAAAGLPFPAASPFEMSGRRRRGTASAGKDAGGQEDPADADVVVLEPPLSEMELRCVQLRGRWELASVLNFMQVFRPVIRSELKISAEEMEMALVTADDTLAQLHIVLLKGIPPVSKNLVVSDAWITVLCKKLKMWWPWVEQVAEGEVPLMADHGGEILRYKELDPVARLLILKALCEIRVQQDDILSYIDEEVKHGGQLSKFRKDSIGRDDKGTTYWHDGDSVLGHRLYRNVTKVEYKQKPRGRGRLTKPVVNFQWETLATNFKEFQEVSDKLSCSRICLESAVGNSIKVDIMPIVEELEKKKERALKRRQREAMLLNGFRNYNIVGSRRSCRDRRPVSYTFDDYDRSINEAIQEAKKIKNAGSEEDEEHGANVAVGKGVLTKSSDEDPAENDVQTGTKELDNDGKHSDSDYEDEDYNEKAEDGHCSSYSDGDTQNNLSNLIKDSADSSRRTWLSSNVDQMGQAEMKKRLRERPMRNTGYKPNITKESEGVGKLGEDLETEMCLSTQMECSAAANELPGKSEIHEVLATAG
ncbi:hypothetical protein Taro_022065, partial [Colocasia esculenta]|nr:hypothetical protein [Colocasia esculenta]